MGSDAPDLVAVLVDPGLKIQIAHPFRVVVAGVHEAFRHLLAVLDPLFAGSPVIDGRQYFEMLRVFVGVVGVFDADHLLMQLLTGTDADYFLLRFWRNHAREVGDLHGRDLLHVDLTTHHVLEGVPNQLDTLFEGNHKPGHTIVCDRQHALILYRHKERDDRAARPHDIAITHHAKTSVVPTHIGVSGHKQLVRGQLGCPVQVDRATGLVGRQCDHTLDAFIDAHIDQVHGTIDVGLDALEGVVFCCRDNLGRRRMHDIVDTIQGTVQSILVANVAYEETPSPVAFKLLGHVPLLHLVTRENDDFFRVVFGQSHRNKGITEGASTAGDEDSLVSEHWGNSA